MQYALEIYLLKASNSTKYDPASLKPFLSDSKWTFLNSEFYFLIIFTDCLFIIDIRHYIE